MILEKTCKIYLEYNIRLFANAFKNYALDRMQNVKDFDSDFDRKLNLYIEENIGTLVTDINETTRKSNC